MTPVTDELPLEEPVGVADVLATLGANPLTAC